MPEALRGLYAVTPDEADGERLLASASAVLAGGGRWLQYRDKQSDAAERRRRAAALAALCRRFGAAMIVNDDVDLALAVGAAGVHLGQADGDPARARALLGADAILGVSCHASLAFAHAARTAGADYAAFGALFPSPTKPGAACASPGILASCRREVGLAACAIGGITLANAPAVIAAGADLLAVITDLFSAQDIAARAAAYQRLFEEKRP